MRVTAGLYRSRQLLAPPGTHTRPTADRLRESLFNILSSRLELRGGFSGLRVADLFAGTGALGLEALSRGAAHCSFAENHPAALKVLRANLGALRIPSAAYTVDDRGTAALLTALTRAHRTLDLVLMDPPYDRDVLYPQTLLALPPLLAPGALVVAEFSPRVLTLPEQLGSLTLTRLYPHGSSALAFYESVTAAREPESESDPKPDPEPRLPDGPPSGDPR